MQINNNDDDGENVSQSNEIILQKINADQKLSSNFSFFLRRSRFFSHSYEFSMSVYTADETTLM